MIHVLSAFIGGQNLRSEIGSEEHPPTEIGFPAIASQYERSPRKATAAEAWQVTSCRASGYFELTTVHG